MEEEASTRTTEGKIQNMCNEMSRKETAVGDLWRNTDHMVEQRHLLSSGVLCSEKRCRM